MTGVSIVVPGADFSAANLGNTVFPVRRGLLAALWPGVNAAESVINLADSSQPAELAGSFVGGQDFLKHGAGTVLTVNPAVPANFTLAMVARPYNSPLGNDTGFFLTASSGALVIRCNRVPTTQLLAMRVYGMAGLDKSVLTSITDFTKFLFIGVRVIDGVATIVYGKDGLIVTGSISSGVTYAGGSKIVCNSGSTLPSDLSALGLSSVAWTDEEIATAYRELRKLYAIRGVAMH